MILASTSLSSNYTTKTSNNSIRDFTILKQFKVTIHHPKAPQIKEVVWHPPPAMMEHQKETLVYLLVEEFFETMKQTCFSSLLNLLESHLPTRLSFVVLCQL